MLQHRVECFFTDFLMSDQDPLGEISEYCIKIEFQARGSPHAHCLLWVKNAPMINSYEDDEEVCNFVERYVHGSLPDAEEDRSLFMKLQTHSHSSYCRRHVNDKCRFNFPKPRTTKTIVARQLRVEERNEHNIEENRHILRLVHENIEKNSSATIEEILEKEHLSEERYLECLKVSSYHGTSIIIKRNVSDMLTNNYNMDCISVWKANMDLQFCAEAYACIMYILSYVMKSERGMSETLKQVAKEFKDKAVEEQMKKCISAFANKREVLIHESGMRVMSQWLFKKTRTVEFVNNAPKQERTRMPKPLHVLNEMDEEDEDVFMRSIHDRYKACPDELEDICLADFATKYSSAADSAEGKNVITLKNNVGKMRLQQKEAVLRTHRYSENCYQYFHSRLLPFMPWRSEDELINGYSTYEEPYNEKKVNIELNAKMFNMDRNDIDEALEEYMANPPEASEWITAGIIENDVEEFIDDEGNKVCVSTKKNSNEEKITSLSLKYKAEALKKTISSAEYYKMMRCLNVEQKEIVMQNRKWIKETIVRNRKGLSPNPFLVFLSGSGGCGKSYCIKMMYRDNVHLFRNCNLFHGEGTFQSNPEDVIALLTAYTGTAAFNINGTTLHAAFQLGQDILSDEKKTTMVTSLEHLMHLTVDEVSMVGDEHLSMLNSRCCMIKHQNPNNWDFGKIGFLAVGDLYQLPPVRARCIFDRSKNPKVAGDIATPIWYNFQLHELTQIMRQKDADFADILNKVRLGKPEKNSYVDKKLKERELHLHEDDPQYPKFVLHVYAENIHAYARNESILNSLPGKQHIITADDRSADKKIDINQLKLPDVISQTGSLHKRFIIKVGARVFLTTNVDVGDGLTNGVFGTVEYIHSGIDKKDGIEKVSHVLVHFDSHRVGIEAKQKSPFKNQYPSAVPIEKIENPFKF